MSVTRTPLKAPFPYFGGKRTVAALVWDRLGDVRNYIEPFCGSAAVLLLRPHDPKIETINDVDCHVANFWRATQQDPDAVVEHCDSPVNEADLHARHRWLVYGDDAQAFRARMREDPDYFDARIAGWWVWGICMWIGGGWCGGWCTKADVHGCDGSKGVHQKMPDISGHRGAAGRGVHGSGLSQQIPGMIGGKDARGVHGRPQLADAYSRGRGVHANDAAGTCDQRRAWLLGWFQALRDRLRTVRVCCGDWPRVCGSRSVTTRIGLTGVFLDPPYSDVANRSEGLYASDCTQVAHDVRAWCLEHGADPKMRIVLCGYAGEHDELESVGWNVHAWKAQGGYANRGGANPNRDRERIWSSPQCERELRLFG